jgi:CMP-N,N'-diacetyllegionaminic acid synthase
MIILISACGGSKRLSHKNIYPLMGKPLLAYTLEAIAATSLNIPAEISGYTASTESVLLHVLDVLAERGQLPQWLMTLPPTPLFRTAGTIRGFAESAAGCASDIDCLMSVTKSRGDFWRMQEDGRIQRLFPDAPRRQQDRTPQFEENSAVYLSRTQALRDTGLIVGRIVRGTAIPAVEGFDINNPHGMRLTECLHDIVYGLAS